MRKWRNYDSCLINGNEFKAEIEIAEKGGNAAAIHGGRILYFMMTCEGELLSLFDDGEWKVPCPEDIFDEAAIAQSYFITTWSKTEEERNRRGKKRHV